MKILKFAVIAITIALLVQPATARQTTDLDKQEIEALKIEQGETEVPETILDEEHVLNPQPVVDPQPVDDQASVLSDVPEPVVNPKLEKLNPFIGVNVVPESFGRGMCISNVISGSPAEGVFRIGMVIHAIDGVVVTSVEMLQAQLKKTDPEKARVTAIDTTGVLIEYEMKLGQIARIDSLGITLGTSIASDNLIVIAVDPNSEATRCSGKHGGIYSLNVGDRITNVNDAAANSLADIVDHDFEENGSVDIRVKNGFYANTVRELKLGGAAKAAATNVKFTGRIVFNDFEGGFYGIVTDTGEKYDPTNLPAQFKQQGMQVSGQLQPRTDLAGIHMWGTIADIVEIDSQ